MTGLLRKAIRETWLTTVLFCLAWALVMAQLTYILPQIQDGMEGVFGSLPFVRTIVTALMGTELGETITAQMMQAMLWVHPVVLALMWAYETVVCTRFPAGEIERGTIDVLLGWPVSRRAVFWSESIIWLAGGLLLFLSGLTGHMLVVSLVLPADARPDLLKSWWVMVNLLGVYAAVGGFAFLVSALNDRRGVAMATVFGVIVFSYLLNFLAQFWSPARSLAFLSILHYYQPARIFQDGVNAQHLLVLGGLATTAWVSAGEIMARREIRTV